MPESSPEILEILENYYLLAKTRRFDHIVISMIDAEDESIACADYAGVIHLELASYRALSLLRKRLEVSIMNWTLPERDNSLDASYAVYNLAHGPLCFDYIVWLITVEMFRIREGAPGPLKVGFWLGADPSRINPQALLWLENVFRPALSLIGAVEDDKAIHGRPHETFVTGNIQTAAKMGVHVPQLRTTERSKYPGHVVITLREADHWPQRNSNIEAWKGFAAYLESRGEKVVFIRDTAKADEPLDGFTTWPEASRDLHCRMAAYQEAKSSLMLSNGPIALCQFSSVPWIEFIPVLPPGSNYEPSTGLFLRNHQGIDVGEQYSWAADNQRIVWKSDTLENLIAMWDEYAPLLENRDAA